MKPGYEPRNFSEAMGWLKEELGEVLQDIGKMERFGFNGKNPDLPAAEQIPNHLKLLRELHDLIEATHLAKEWIAVLSMAKQELPVTAAQLAARIIEMGSNRVAVEGLCTRVLHLGRP